MEKFLFIIPLALFVFVCYARKGGGGKIGRKIRSSDHWALEDAIEEKEREIKEKEGELKQLKALRPKYKI